MKGIAKKIMGQSSIIEDIGSKCDIILASSSPRRYEILHDVMGINNLKLMKPTFEEDLDKSLYENDPIRYVCDTSRCKAEGIVQELRAEEEEGQKNKFKLIICADTVVIDSNNIIYEKPKNKVVQLKNLKKFCYEDNGKPLTVVTAVTLIRWSNKNDFKMTETFHEETKIFCDNKIPLRLLEEYVEGGDGIAVAGGFKIQGMSGMIVEKIDGDYYNVVGLPLNKTFQAIYRESCVQ